MENVRIGNDCNLGEGVFVESGVTIGNHCTVKNGVALWDGVTLNDYVFVGPNAVFTNDIAPRTFLKDWKDKNYRKTIINFGATIGANCTLICGITVGDFAMIGAGSVVTHDVPPHTLVVGVPGKTVGRVCFCGKKIIELDYCTECERKLSENSFQSVLACRGISRP